MTLVKPLDILFENRQTPEGMSYLGNVEDNNDPEKLGRVRVRIEPYTDMATEELPWCSPMLGTSGNSPDNCGLNIPERGSQVRVIFPSKDFTAPYYTGAELNTSNRSSMFDEDYPNTYGYRDSTGNFIKVNKAKESIHIQHSSNTNFKVAANGSIKIELSNGTYVVLDNCNNFVINNGVTEIEGSSDGNVKISAKTGIELATNGGIRLNGNKIECTGNLSAGNGASGDFPILGGVVTVNNGIITSIKGIA